ncbi:MAG: LysM peptidoglycan-binding domain-containing protein [Treponema sp.]|jgi:hypothetical protein|nr:LysM peptidoglycan-binding domain-containing protein [Treponema sp.]
MQKKHLVCLTSLIAVSLLAACKTAPTSTPTPAEEQQEEVNLSFENVYNRYESRLILDGAVDYEVKSGDRLTGIARQFYGSGEQFGVSNGYFFPLIMLASNDLVQDPDLIEPGMTLSVPDLQRNLDSAAARQAMKEFFRDIAGVYGQKAGDETREDRRKLAEQTRSSLLKLSEML